MRRGSIVASGITLVALGALRFFRGRSRSAVRSVIEDEEGTSGWDRSATHASYHPALSGFLAALVAVTQSMVRPITVSAGFSITVFALIVTVLGGLGRSPGPCSRIILGTISNIAVPYIGTFVADHPARRSSGDHLHPTVRAARSEGMTEQYTEATGTSVIVARSAERRDPSRRCRCW